METRKVKDKKRKKSKVKEENNRVKHIRDERIEKGRDGIINQM